MEPVARELLGEPNAGLSKPSSGELRFRNRGSMSVNVPPHPQAGHFYDFESATGGGVIDFVEHVRGVSREAAREWLQDRGHLAGSYTRPSARVAPVAQPALQKSTQTSPLKTAQSEKLRRLGWRLWNSSVPLPRAADTPPGRWREDRHLWRPSLPWPAPLRWIPADVFRKLWKTSPDVAGVIVAPLATVSDWLDSWPNKPKPAAIHLIAIDDLGRKAYAWDGRDKSRINLEYDIPTPPVLIFGASPERRIQCVVVEGVADALGVASRVDAALISTVNLASMQGAPKNGFGEDLRHWDHVMIYADDDRKPERTGAPPGLRGAHTLRRAIEAAGGSADVRHLPGGKDGADWAAAQPFVSLDNDTFSRYSLTLKEMYPAWPPWERARTASICTTCEEDQIDGKQ